MKKQYTRPAVAVVAMQDICSNGLDNASVQTPDHKTIDNFKVVEEEQSKTDYDWSKDSWGGN